MTLQKYLINETIEFLSSHEANTGTIYKKYVTPKGIIKVRFSDHDPNINKGNEDFNLPLYLSDVDDREVISIIEDYIDGIEIVKEGDIFKDMKIEDVSGGYITYKYLTEKKFPYNQGDERKDNFVKKYYDVDQGREMSIILKLTTDEIPIHRFERIFKVKVIKI